MNRIDRLIQKARQARGVLEISTIDVDYTVDGWEVTVCLWDGVRGSARGRDDWRLKTVHASPESAAAHINELKEMYPTRHAIPVIVDTFAFGGNIYAYQI